MTFFLRMCDGSILISNRSTAALMRAKRATSSARTLGFRRNRGQRRKSLIRRINSLMARFNSLHAECVFVFGADKRITRDLVADIRSRAAAHGRDPRDILIFYNRAAVVGRTHREAEEKYREYHEHASIEGAIAHFASSTGINFARYEPDEPIRYIKNDAINSAVETLTKLSAEPWTVRRIVGRMGLGSRNPAIVGSAEEVADDLIAWVHETDIDGFNLSRIVTPKSLEDFVDLVVPILQELGAYKRDYLPDTLREKLFGRSRLLPPSHPGTASPPPPGEISTIRPAGSSPKSARDRFRRRLTASGPCSDTEPPRWEGVFLPQDRDRGHLAVPPLPHHRALRRACWTAGCPDMRQNPVGEPAATAALNLGNLGKIISPLGLALIVGGPNIIRPEASVNAVIPAMFFLAFWAALAAAAFVTLGIETKGRSIEEIDAALAKPASLL